MNTSKSFREMAKILRKAGDIAENIATNIEDETLSNEEREKKEEQLMGEFMVQMVKMNAIKF